MTRPAQQNRNPLARALVVGGLCYWGWDYWLGRPPILTSYGQINPWAALLVLGMTTSALTLTSALLRRLAALNSMRLAKRATGFKGTSGFATLKDLKHELLTGWGPYWGAVWDRGKYRELMIDYVSNALTVSPAGSGKDSGVVDPTVFSIRESKTVVAMKGTSPCVLADELRNRGEDVFVLNLGDVWSDILGPSDTYNPLCWLVDSFWEPGGILDVADDAHEFAKQLLPEPAKQGGGDGNKFFRDGSRDLTAFAIQACVLVKGRDATLGDIAQMLNDRQSLLQHARWMADRLVIEDDNDESMGEVS